MEETKLYIFNKDLESLEFISHFLTFKRDINNNNYNSS